MRELVKYLVPAFFSKGYYTIAGTYVYYRDQRPDKIIDRSHPYNLKNRR